jgi:hypothetical protein
MTATSTVPSTALRRDVARKYEMVLIAIFPFICAFRLADPEQ